MRDSSAPERPRLAGPGLLLALAGTVGAALTVLHPRPSAPPPESAPPQVQEDEVALAWLTPALAQRPGDVALRLRLARGQQRLFLHEEARQTLAPLLHQPGREGTQARLLALEGALARWRQQVGPREAGPLAEAVQALSGEPLTVEEHQHLMKVALELGRPGLAAAGAERLSGLAPGHRHVWWEEAGRHWLAAGEAARAAEAWARGAESAPEAEAEALAVRALEAARAMPEGARALALAERLLTRLPHGEALRERAVALALAQGALPQASRWAAERARRAPTQVEAWRHWREVALAAGEVESARVASARLVQLLPEEAREWRWLARVAGWAGDAGSALRAWHWLALRAAEPEARSQALGLASQVRDTRRLVEVLARPGTALPAQEEALLLSSYEQLGEPERAEAWLQAQPAEAGRLRQLARLQERQGRLLDALATWEAVAREADASGDALAAQGELLWRLGRAPEALARLSAGRARLGPEALPAWRLLAELAWRQDAEEEAREAYAVLWRHAPPEPLVARRLARLLAEQGGRAEQQGALARARAHYAEALAVEEKDTLARLGMLRLLERLGEREALAGLLARWSHEAEGDAAYFEPYARALQRLGRPAEAAVWFERQARTRPWDGQVRLEQAQALEEAGEDARARQARAVALALLRPGVEAALPRLPEPEATARVLRAVLAAERQGEDSLASPWAAALLERAGEVPSVQDWALARALAREDIKEVRHRVSRLQRAGRQPPAWLLLRLALEDGRAAAISTLLESRGGELALPDRVFAERWLGRRERARALLTQEPRGALEAPQLALLAVHARELSEQLDPRVRLVAALERQGALESLHLGAEGQAGGPGGSPLRVRAAHRLLRESHLGLSAREVEGSLEATLGPDRQPTEVRLGLTWRDSRLLPSVRVRHRLEPAPRVRLGAEASWGERAEETGLLLLLGRKHQVSGTLALGLPAQAELSAAVRAGQYRLLPDVRLGEGLGGALHVAWPWTTPWVDGQLRLGGTLEERWLRPGLPGELVALWPSGTALLPGRSGSLGLGMSLKRERQERVGGTFLLEAWGGWLWPEGRPGYRLQMGGGLASASGGELTARLTLANVSGGAPAEPYQGVELGWEYRF